MSEHVSGKRRNANRAIRAISAVVAANTSSREEQIRAAQSVGISREEAVAILRSTFTGFEAPAENGEADITCKVGSTAQRLQTLCRKAVGGDLLGFVPMAGAPDGWQSFIVAWSAGPRGLILSECGSHWAYLRPEGDQLESGHYCDSPAEAVASMLKRCA